MLQVASSTDEVNWRLEHTFARGTDLREPRFLSWNGALYLYLTELGSDRLAFEPHGVFMSQRGSDETAQRVRRRRERGRLRARRRRRLVRGDPQRGAGAQGGFGSKLCSAPAARLSNWKCTDDARKFDSPHMFQLDGEAYLLARRNVSRDGAHDRDGAFQLLRSIGNQLT